jgi:hypothetical protein
MAEAFPLQWPEGWPRTPSGRRRKSKFGSNLGISQVTMLKNELRLLGAKNVIVSSNVAVRNDGLPYAAEGRRRYDDPGVAVFFTLNGKPKSMARDPYYTPWENVRSLVLAVDAMRSLERHGGSAMVERAFSGFAALAPPPPTKRHWSDVLQVNRSATKEVIQANFKRLAMDRHPDQGGTDAQLSELVNARNEALSEIR